MRQKANGVSTLSWLHGDHLGSAVHHHGCRRHEDQRVALQTLRRGAHHLGQHAHRPALPGPTVRRHHRRFWRTVPLCPPWAGSSRRIPLCPDRVIPKASIVIASCGITHSRGSIRRGTRMESSVTIGGLILGVVFGVLESNIPPSQQASQAADALSVEESSFAAGRVAGNAGAIAQGFSRDSYWRRWRCWWGQLVFNGWGCLRWCTCYCCSTMLAGHGVAVAGNASVQLAKNASFIKGQSDGSLEAQRANLQKKIGSEEGLIEEHQQKLTSMSQ